MHEFYIEDLLDFERFKTTIGITKDTVNLTGSKVVNEGDKKIKFTFSSYGTINMTSIVLLLIGSSLKSQYELGSTSLINTISVSRNTLEVGVILKDSDIVLKIEIIEERESASSYRYSIVIGCSSYRGYTDYILRTKVAVIR